MRTAGILLHPSSFPSSFGIGDLGPMAYRFLDWIAGAGISVWQILPLGPVDGGGSPYCSPSAFAGNPLLISPEQLLADGFITADHLEAHRLSPQWTAEPVDYPRVVERKRSLLEIAYERFCAGEAGQWRDSYQQFIRNHAEWLEPYALFMALADVHQNYDWTRWPVGSDLGRRLGRGEAVDTSSLGPEVERLAGVHRFGQFLFDLQWRQLRDHAHRLGIRIVGDMPMYVAHASSDAWSHPDLFELNEAGVSTNVAGVPPDYFSATGQLWGNPLYNWAAMKEDGYAWWVSRIRNDLQRADVVRIDHFRGLEAYWSVPASASTAAEGEWRPGPGADLLSTLCQAGLQSAEGNLFDGCALPLIAEDLGLITPEVLELRQQFGLPGMSVLQFAFAQVLPDDRCLPDAIPEDSVAYTGTHDNDTTLGWFRSDIQHVEHAVARLERYGAVDAETVSHQLIRFAWQSRASLAVAPLQDVLGLGSEARMNIPGTADGNWKWRFPAELLTDSLRNWLATVTLETGRSISGPVPVATDPATLCANHECTL